ncbi:26S proteasome non-ATPase regulatory subunit 1, partial [Rhizopus stolonifer]
MTALTSANGIIALLDEQQPELKVYALEQLNTLVDEFWAEISDSIAKIEILYEDTSFAQRELAALVASKVYYNLGELDDSLTFALGAGQSFDLSESSEYVTTIISKCIDKYIHLRTSVEALSETIDPRLQDIVERMFQRCAEDHEYEQAIGIALESRRLDVIQSIIQKQGGQELLAYVLEVCMTLVQNLEFRNQVLRLLVNLYKTLENPDYISISQCLVHLNDFSACADMLKHLVEKDNE